MAKARIIVLKCIFFAVVVFSAGLVTERLTGIKRWWKDDSIVVDDLVYNASIPLKSRNYDKVLNKRYLRCLTEPSKPFCSVSANKRLDVFRSENEELPSAEEIESRLHNITSDFPSRRRKIHTLLVEFTRIMKTYRVNVILVEPSMLFCLLSSTAKLNILEKGFNPGRVLGSRNVVTIGVLDVDSKKLEEKNVTSEILSAGFKITKFRKWVGDESKKEFETVHYLFIMQDVAAHVVVFYTKNDYVWHSGLDAKEIDFQGLLFVNEEIYENFTLLPLNLAGTSISRLFLPHDMRYFMKEMEFSEVVKCRTNSSGITSSIGHPFLTKEQLITRVVIVLKELKAIFSPYISPFFWLWTESLFGWFTECDIFHFSSTLNLAVHFTSIQELPLSEILSDNEFLKVDNITEVNSKYGCKLDCHGLPINIYFIYKDDGFMWHKFGDSENRVYKYPLFTLCSSELYGQKIQVPCNATEVLAVEFSKNGTWNDHITFS